MDQDLSPVTKCLRVFTQLRIMTTNNSNRVVAVDQVNPIESLPEDVLTTILLKLSRESLHRSAAVSKAWRRMISDPIFARLYEAVHSHKGGFYLQNGNAGVCKYIPDNATSTAPWAHNLLEGVPTADGTVPWYSRHFAVGASGGLFLFNTTTIKTMGAAPHWSYIVYSPERRKGFFVLLPPHRRFYTFEGFICNPAEPRFLLIRLQWLLQAVDVFDSHLWRWEERRINVNFDLDHRRLPQVFDEIGVAAHGGLLYWICTREYVVCYDHSRSELSLIRLPQQLEEGNVNDQKRHRLMSSGDRLVFTLLVDNYMTLRLWILNKFNKSWTVYRSVSLQNLFLEGPIRRSGGELIGPGTPYVIGLDPEDPSRVFFWAQNAVVSLDLKNNSVKKLCTNIPWGDYQLLPICSSI